LFDVRLRLRLASLALLFAAIPARAAPRLAQLYDAMFDSGHAWTYEVAVTEFGFVEDKRGAIKLVPMKPVLSKVTCQVTDVAATTNTRTSTIECDGDIDSSYGFRPDGNWIATNAGLWREALEGVDVDPPLVRSSPVAMRKRAKDSYGGYLVRTVTRDNASWCVIDDTTHGGLGDGAITTMCFRDGVGLVRAKYDYHGGTPRIVEYKLARS
jgi:hypothetical protein